MGRRTLILVMALAAVAAFVAAGPRDEMWKKVEEAVNKGLPKTAIERLDPIIAQAVKEKAYPEAIKAIAKKIALEGTIQGNKPEERITRLEAEIAKAPDEMKPVMEAILAHWYWHYFQQNRWRFVQRTQTAEPPGKDFTTWDLPRILAEIDAHFTKALSHEKKLKAIPIGEYDALLQKGTVPDTYRPTLFDFIAHEALSFYQAGEQAGARAEDAFEVSADSPIFGTVEEFLAWKPETTDAQSPTLKAVKLYQNLLSFHQKDADQTAFVDADLLRLTFGYNTAFGERKNEKYRAALKRFIGQWADHEISARAISQLARLVQEEGDLVEARTLALRGYDAFPNSIGGAMCYNIAKEIEAKSLSISTERVWNDPWPDIAISYRNLTKVYFKAIAWDYESLLKTRNPWGIEYVDDRRLKEVLGKKEALAWSVDLPATDDYKERTEYFSAPGTLQPGFYFIIASVDPSFGERNNQVSYASVWVSDLALILRTRQGTGAVEGFVLDAKSGTPLKEAQVKSWIWQEREQVFSQGPSGTTDAQGMFRISIPDGSGYRPCFFLASYGSHRLAASEQTYLYRSGTPQRSDTRVVLFTDRSLYRPGQTVNYKGICIRVDQHTDAYETVGGASISVVFRDPNGKEIERHAHRTNDYGSFSGSFTAPRDRLTGRMSIAAEQYGGAVSVNVEEYKRPKFQVALEPPKDAPKLNEMVTVEGKATAYTGAAIGGAQVKYRVVRQVRYPEWWGWYRWWWSPPERGSQEIAHGSTVTAADGSFTIAFTAKPDLSVPENDEPIFLFEVTADVTDTTGETRSAGKTVCVGYTALAASMSAAEWQTPETPVVVSVFTKTLDGVGQAAKGVVRVYRLKEPEIPGRPALVPRKYRWSGAAQPKPDPSNPNSWPLADMVSEKEFDTDASGTAAVPFDLKAGVYRAVLETKDRYGKKVAALLPLLVVDPAQKRFETAIPQYLCAPKWSVEPGEKFIALWATGYEKGRAYVEIEHRGKIVAAYWTDADRTQQVIEQSVTEEMRGGFIVRITYVRENRAYLTSRRVDVPWTNKNLTVRWERFTSKLEPGQKEIWTAVISGPDAKKAVAEMVASLYDASLDAYLPHSWGSSFGVFRQEYDRVSSRFENAGRQFSHILGMWPSYQKSVDYRYRSFPDELTVNLWGYAYFGAGGRGRMLRAEGDMALMALPPAPAADAARAMNRLETEEQSKGERKAAADRRAGAEEGSSVAPADLEKVSARKNLNETAFFFPHLVSDEDGVVKMEFVMPEALTEWKFLGFAHDRELRAGLLTDKVVTAKDLMVEPNPPRFVREGDVIEFTVKVSNQSAARQAGTVRLTFADARTLASADAALGNRNTDIQFDIPSKESRSFSWRISVPDGTDFLTYKAVGSTGRLSDGEEGFLPVLSRRILVTESLPLPVRGPATKEFRFQKLLDSGKSRTLKQENLTVQMVSHPAWYAVMALPYLMEYPYECTEQVFNRFYANSIARYIAQSDPKIRRVFDLWKGTPALDSPLEKNQDIKAVMLEETPWLRQAMDESAARKNVGILFDDNRLNDEMSRALRKITEWQYPDGSWPWFPGGRRNDYITLYITTGFGRMRHLGVDVDVSPAVRAIDRLDAWADEQYREIVKHGNKDSNHLSATTALYLYCRSFFLKDKPVPPERKEAVDYWLSQARTYWLSLNWRQPQGHLAIALKRFGDASTAQDIMKSIKERSVSSEEMGMFWRDLELSWWWFRAPIETQAVMIEAFDEVMGDRQAVEDCKVWLIKQKQTQDWKTTKATADAIYALLLRGRNLLASDKLVSVSLAGKEIKPEKVEAGTGFYEQKFLRAEIRPEMGRITVKKVDEGVSWGSVHWQYLEDMSKVTPYEGTPLKLKKTLFVKEYTSKGPVLKPVSGPVKVGDELVVRIELRVDRDMEYVHLKDQRGSGTEPENVLSRYKYQDGLGYYEATKDTATHFFIDYLPKGTYVFEYSTRVQLKGKYQTGIASIQCMYAPEFNSHSESILLEVK